jgi:hypothetical protein
MFVLMIGPIGNYELNMTACLQQEGIDIGIRQMLKLESRKRVFCYSFSTTIHQRHALTKSKLWKQVTQCRIWLLFLFRTRLANQESLLRYP